MKSISIFSAAICLGACLFLTVPGQSEVRSGSQRPDAQVQDQPLPQDTAALQVQGGKLGIVGVHYRSGSAAVEERFVEHLGKIAEALNSEKLRYAKILIKGHSDNRGSEEDNLALSRLRARNAMELLVDRFGINRERLTFDGAGETAPIASNATEDGRYLNRRIEFVYLGDMQPDRPGADRARSVQP